MGVSQTEPAGEAGAAQGQTRGTATSQVDPGHTRAGGCLLTKVKASKELSFQHHENVAGVTFTDHRTVTTENATKHMGVGQCGGVGVGRAFTQTYWQL